MGVWPFYVMKCLSVLFKVCTKGEDCVFHNALVQPKFVAFGYHKYPNWFSSASVDSCSARPTWTHMKAGCDTICSGCKWAPCKSATFLRRAGCTRSIPETPAPTRMLKEPSQKGKVPGCRVYHHTQTVLTSTWEKPATLRQDFNSTRTMSRKIMLHPIPWLSPVKLCFMLSTGKTPVWLPGRNTLLHAFNSSPC